MHQMSVVPLRWTKGLRFSSIPGAGMLVIGGIKLWQFLIYKQRRNEVELPRAAEAMRENDSICGDLGSKGTFLYQDKSHALREACSTSEGSRPISGRAIRGKLGFSEPSETPMTSPMGHIPGPAFLLHVGNRLSLLH